MSLLATRRLLRILRVVIRYRLDDLLLTLPLPTWMRALRFALPWRWLPRAPGWASSMRTSMVPPSRP